MSGVNIPNLTGPFSLTAGETTLGHGTQKIGTLAQVSGIAAGFDVFTPTTNATYWLVIRVQDVATGAPANACVDVLALTTIAGTWTPQSISHTVTVGTCATTWSRNVAALKVAIATGATWYVDVHLIRFSA